MRHHDSEIIKYQYRHEETEATTGYFSCEPEDAITLERLPAMLLSRPLDSFLRRCALKSLARLGMPGALGFLQEQREAAPCDAELAAVLESLRLELAGSFPEDSTGSYESNSPPVSGSGPEIMELTPLLTLRRGLLPDAALHAAWADLFNGNIQGHRKLPPFSDTRLPHLFDPARPQESPRVTLRELCDGTVHGEPGEAPSAADGAKSSASAQAAPGADEVAALALERLAAQGVLAGEEQRHVASLSPIALLLPWKLDIEVHSGRNRYRLSGRANTYGRGLSLAQARASCRMEMVERYSAYVPVKDGRILGRKNDSPLVRARLSELAAEGRAAVDPNDFYIEVPYRDEELYWAEGLRAERSAPDAKAAYSPVLVPLQMAALFCNLDEVDLCSAPGSTGIATGSVWEQAALAGLTEVLERDAEATTLYHKKRCFRLDAPSVSDPMLGALLADYAALGINLQFMDMTGPLGLPCYQAFVIGPKGTVHRGHGAGLSGSRALVSAITETPYPYPGGGPSGPMPRKLPERTFGELPEYGRGSHAADLALLEALLCRNGMNPVYVDLTHAGLEFPVVRALVPGCSPAADFDSFSRLSPKLYQDYLNLQEI